MGRKADKMKELMDHLGGPDNKVLSAEKIQVEARSEPPLEIMLNAKQDKIHTEKSSMRKVIVKRIHFRK